jgi:protein-disulfide isomerase
VNYQFIGADSFNAGMATESVFKQKPSAFWDYYKAIYAAQGAENSGWASPAKLVEIAKQANLGIDYEKLRKDLDDQVYEQVVLEDNKLAKKYKITGTPSLLINEKLVKFTSYDELKKLIEDEVKAVGSKK